MDGGWVDESLKFMLAYGNRSWRPLQVSSKMS